MRRSRCIALSSVARAQGTDRSPAPADPHAAQPERPTVATHAGTVAPGWVEIETGVERDHLHGAHTFFTPTVLKLGVAPRVQLELASSFVHLSGTTPDYSGIGDVSAALKWRALEHAPVLGDFALQPSLKLPSGSALHGTGTGTTDVGLLLISSHDWGEYALDINAGYTRRSGRRKPGAEGRDAVDRVGRRPRVQVARLGGRGIRLSGNDRTRGESRNGRLPHGPDR